MRKKIKGRDVTLLTDIGGSMKVLAASTSCTLTINAETTDVSTKDDENSLFENVDVMYFAWSAKNESFVADKATLRNVLKAWLNAEPITTKMNIGPTGGSVVGKAYITGLSVSASAKDKAKLSLDLTGNGNITNNALRS